METMSRFHPVLSYLCLLVFALVGSWLLLAAIFLFFPALPYDWDANGPSLSDLQRLGNVVTRVYFSKYEFPYHEWKFDVQETRDLLRESFAIDYHLNSSVEDKTTRLVLNKEISLDLHAYWNRIDKASPVLEADANYYVSEPIYITAKQGDIDGINPPWFKQADACLLFWEIHREVALLPLRLKVFDYPDGNQLIELWPDSKKWDKSDSPSLKAGTALTTVHSYDTFIRNTTLQFPRDVETEQSSPTRTFALRRGIQSILVPTGLFVYNHSGFVATGLATVLYVFSIAFMVVAIYLLVVHLCWVANGKPTFRPWSRSHWLTRYALARLPIHNVASQIWDRTHNDSSESKRRPQPLRGIGDFFRSRSPLDDLFVTFEFTKYMVEPIRFARTTSNLGERAQVTGVPNDFKFNVSHRTSRSGCADQQDEQSDLEQGKLPA